MITILNRNNTNCYVISENQKAVLVDTGELESRNEIETTVDQFDLQAIVLTHGHYDHVDNAAYFSARYHVPIIMGKHDKNINDVNSFDTCKTNSPVGMLILNKCKKHLLTHTIEHFVPDFEAEEISDLRRFGVDAKIIFIPGHTSGSIGVLTKDGDLIVGDAAIHIGHPRKAIIYETMDKVNQSMEMIEKLHPNMIYYGHGLPTNAVELMKYDARN